MIVTLPLGKQAKTGREKSRAWLVGEVIYPNVDESKFAALFSDNKGSRPQHSGSAFTSVLLS